MALLHRVAEEQQVAMLLSAHEMNALLPVMDRIVYLTAGRAASGTTDEVVRSDVLSQLYGHHVDVLKLHGRVLVVAEPGPGGPRHPRPPDPHHLLSHRAPPVRARASSPAAPVRTAVVIGSVTAVVSAVVGVFTVVRSQSFAGHALTDVATTGGSAAFYLGLAPLVGFIGGGVLGAGAMEVVGVQRVRSRDLATGIVLGAATGLAALFLYLDTTT